MPSSPTSCPITIKAYASSSDFGHTGEFQAATTVGYTTWTFWPPKSDTYIYTEMEKVVTGEVSPASYCHGLQQLFRQERSAGNVPASPPPSGGL